MEKQFSTKLLCIDEDGKSVLNSFGGRLQPGQPFLPVAKDKIVLAGGFPSLSPETDFPLSPTLQLTSDLTTLTAKELQALAEAEQARINSINFHSYTVEANLQVLVIATDVLQLQQFVDSYGGILEIEPLLLNTNHPDFASVTEIDIGDNKEGYEIRFTERSPLNRDLCNYCGECGVACPERCISSFVQVNYDKCTFCKECERVCGTNALDIYGVEEKRICIPAVILLDGVSVDQPENRSGIYHKEQLFEYFGTLFSSNIEEVVCHNNSICQYSGRLGYGCSRCVDSCPHDAVSQDENGVGVDHLLCEECGNCIAVCPTGSMQYARHPDQAWLEFFKRTELLPGKTVVIGAEKELHSLWWQQKGQKYDDIFFLEYANIGALTSLHLLTLFALGAHRVALLDNGLSSHSSPMQHQVEMTNYIVSSLYDKSFVELIDTSEFEKLTVGDERHPLEQFFCDFSYKNRRSKLAEVVAFLVSVSAKTISSHRSFRDFAKINCDADKCTHCMACLGECSMRAMGADEENLRLTYSAGNCVGCGVCVRICPENALTLGKDYVIDEDFFLQETIAQAEPARCKECGKVFGTRKSLDRVMQILSAREPVNSDHFEYCDTCKVVKIFEAEI